MEQARRQRPNRRTGDLGGLFPAVPLIIQLRLREHEPSAPVAGLRHGLVRPAPEGPGQDERRRRRVAAERQAYDQAADLRDAEGHEKLAGGAPPPLAAFSIVRRPTRNASASMARVTCRCQPCQLRTS